MFALRQLRIPLGLAAAALLAACSAHGANVAPPVYTQSLVSTPIQTPAVPPACKGQTTTKTHSIGKEKLLSTGGHACIPAFAGFGGNIAYPGAKPSITVTLTSSTTNYNGKLPSLGSGTPVFYLQIATSGPTSFSSSAPVGGGLTSAKIKVGQTYTVFGQAKISGFPVNFTPCYTVATTGKFGGVIGGMGSLLKGQTVPAAATGVLEVYSGQQASNPC